MDNKINVVVITLVVDTSHRLFFKGEKIIETPSILKDRIVEKINDRLSTSSWFNQKHFRSDITIKWNPADTTEMQITQLLVLPAPKAHGNNTYIKCHHEIISMIEELITIYTTRRFPWQIKLTLPSLQKFITKKTRSFIPKRIRLPISLRS